MLTPPPFSAATVFCVWGRTVDVIKLARFQVNRLRSFGAPGAENDPLPLTWRIALTRATLWYSATLRQILIVHSVNIPLVYVWTSDWMWWLLGTCLQPNITFICHLAAGLTFTKTDFSRRVFRFSAPSAWNSLPQTVLSGDCLSVLNLDLILFFIHLGFRWTLIPPASSASEVKTVGVGYINLIIIIIIYFLYPR